jgi:phosphoribosyl-dephospho-CoA transferase
VQIGRHQIVHLDPAAWPVLIERQPDVRAIPIVAEWAIIGRPLIARRRLCSDGEGSVPLGLPLPPSMGKQRLAFDAAPDAILSTAPPPLLADASMVAPAAWRPTLDRLVAIDPDVRCFGSLAWEYLTGLPYLSATSDIDLLWHLSTLGDADRLAEAIASIDESAAMRIDGEIVSPDGVAIQWREWGGGASELLAKTWDGNRMIARDTVFA